MAAPKQTEEDQPRQKGYSKGVWLWDDPDHGGYVKFDDATSNQIEEKLRSAIDGRLKGPVTVQLSEGPWFSRPQNKGVYSVVLIVDCSDPDYPVIHSARQTNTNSGYKRPIKRKPELKPPVDPKHVEMKMQLKGKWEWKDDYGWTEYDVETMKQIDDSYEAGEEKCDLSKGSFFGKNPNIYYILFNRLSLPASAQQHNRKSRYARWVRRTPMMNEMQQKEEQGQEAFFLDNDPHFFQRRHYFPLSKEDFMTQMNDAKLKENLKCSICITEFEEKELLENQKPEQAAKSKKACNGGNDNDEKNNNNNGSNKHQYDLSGAVALVSDTTVVGLNKCAFGHYFHAHCILRSLTESNVCPNCKTPYGIIVGNQPDGRLYITRNKGKCVGFDDASDSIKMLFEFPGGIQGKNHPHPGKMYFGDLREAFLPNNKAGREAAMLTRWAFKRRLIFHIGTSLTLQQENRIVFGSIHLKTSTSGGAEKHGYPDEKYFDRFKNELEQKGITTELLTKEELQFIEKGFPKGLEATQNV